MKVISWCLYIDSDNINRLPEYLFGLRCNQRAARVWFPGWKLRLYIHASVRISPAVWKYVDEIASYGYPKIELIDCDVGKNPMTERYRPFVDDSVDVCIVRDLDSILSKVDADMVNQWLNNDNMDVLRYREYQQEKSRAMGGGIGIKCKITHDKKLVDSTSFGRRGYDECKLEHFLKNNTDYTRHIEVLTRMTMFGVYCLYNNNINNATILWTVPFYDTIYGLACNQLGYEYLECASIRQIVEHVKDLSIKREHIGAHYDHHNQTIIAFATTHGWIR